MPRIHRSSPKQPPAVPMSGTLPSINTGMHSTHGTHGTHLAISSEDDGEADHPHPVSHTDDDEDHMHTMYSSSDDSASSPGHNNDPDDDDDDDDEDDDHTPFQHPFAPPYYGRPPTPLPPSPSLTSLLRPSRPTTPDASDDELEPVPRAAPQIPTYEYYGFVVYVVSSAAFLVYVLWAFLPSRVLHAMGIYYYPSRWWALAIPCWLLVSILYIVIAVTLYNAEVMTLQLGALETIVDEAGTVAAVDAWGNPKPWNGEVAAEEVGDDSGDEGGRRRKVDWRSVWNEGTDAVLDVPLGGVNEILYLNNDDDDDDYDYDEDN